MLQHTTLEFIAQLKRNNNTEWFKNHQKLYKASRVDFEQMIQNIIHQLAELDTSIAKQDLQAKKCIKRINRDIRFSKDKSPYKTNYFAIFNPNGHKTEAACYYLSLEPGNSFVGGGVYMASTPVLNKFRKEIDYDLQTWENIISSDDFKTTFPNGVQSPSELKSAPKGFDKESPTISYLRMKGFYAMHKLSDKDMTSTHALTLIMNAFQKVQPMVSFLNEGL